LKTTTKATIVALVVLVGSIVVVMTAASTAAWVPADVKAFTLVILQPAIVAILLVVYFDGAHTCSVEPSVTSSRRPPREESCSQQEPQSNIEMAPWRQARRRR
jgi:hypothetical protein